MLSAYRLLADDYRGRQFYVAPGTDKFSIRGGPVNPDNANSGITPFVPFATVDAAVAQMLDGDTLILMKEGDYMMGSNIASSLAHIKMLPWPGLHPQLVTVHGVAGGTPMTLSGRGVYLGGFSIETADAAFGDLTIKGAYSILEDMHLDSDGDNTPAWGLKLVTELSGPAHASSVIVSGGRIADCAVGLFIDFLINSEYPGPTDVLVENIRFKGNTTRDIGQNTNASAGISGWNIRRCDFSTLLGTEFIRLNNAANGSEQANLIADNVFGYDAVTATQVALTSAKFHFIGNRDKAGFITTL